MLYSINHKGGEWETTNTMKRHGTREAGASVSTNKQPICVKQTTTNCFPNDPHIMTRVLVRAFPITKSVQTQRPSTSLVFARTSQTPPHIPQTTKTCAVQISGDMLLQQNRYVKAEFASDGTHVEQGCQSPWPDHCWVPL